MSQSKPDWYDALQGDPLKEKTFTNQLALKIKAQATSSSNKESSVNWTRRLSFISGAIICVIGLLLFANQSDIFNPTVTDKVSSVNVSNTLVTSSVLDIEQLQSKTVLTDSEWQELINVNTSNSNKELLFTQSIKDNVMLVFSRSSEDTSTTQLIGFDYFEWTSQKWNWAQGVTFQFEKDHTGAYIVNNNNKKTTEESLITAWSGLDTIPLFYGMVVDPQISQIRITDDQQLQKNAVIIPSKDGNMYWFAAFPSTNDGYKVESLDSEGNVITNETYYYH